MIQTLSDFLLSFFKLSINRILIGLLTIALAVSIYQNLEQAKDFRSQLLVHKAEIDTLRSGILLTAIKTSEKEMKMIKDCYEEKQLLSDKIEAKINNLKK